jgi:hypothetical protein
MNNITETEKEHAAEGVGALSALEKWEEARN